MDISCHDGFEVPMTHFRFAGFAGTEGAAHVKSSWRALLPAALDSGGSSTA
jgi:hypothetical protein